MKRESGPSGPEVMCEQRRESLSGSGQFMRHAASLALRGRGKTAPNPCVGALLVHPSGRMAAGWHARCGGPHAEVEALGQAGRADMDPSRCTLYVTLEPCNHHGRTPPCTRALLDAGVPRVIIGALDPNPRVTGGGAEFLRSKGVAVETGVERDLCEALIADFLVWTSTDRPYVITKLAMTLDGKTAARTGHSAWVSGPASRARVHDLRRTAQAVMVGNATLLHDDPRLTTRDGNAPLPVQPLAVIVGSRLEQDHLRTTLVRDRAAQTVFLTSDSAAVSPAGHALRDAGCRVWSLPELPGRGLDLLAGLSRLRAEAGVFTLLCEGGSRLAMALLEQGCTDELLVFCAPKILGDPKAVPLFSGPERRTMTEALPLRLTGVERLEDDLLLSYRTTGRAD